VPLSQFSPTPKKKKSEGTWIVTFADLATLLLTFFILLLSFAKMDVAKYELMAASMADALGTGRPSVLESTPVAPPIELPQAQDPGSQPEFIEDRGNPDEPVMVSESVVELAGSLINGLQQQVADGALSVTYEPDKVVVRFADEDTFESGDATLVPRMRPIIDKIVSIIASCQGAITVGGYTDDRPIISNRYRSNWDLSAARAVSVVHELILNRQIDASSVTAAGHAETNPLVPNDSAENRARNRRVELVIRDPVCDGTSTPIPGVSISP